MINKLHYITVSSFLLSILKTLMNAAELKKFRLVGGTALSLYRGHRISADIDLFSDAQYGSIDFNLIDKFLQRTFQYVDTTNAEVIGAGKSYFAGNNKDECVKLDIFYSDEKFIRNEVLLDGIRLASIEDIIAMKIEMISVAGRKKDFWDIHELMDDYSIGEMIAFHKQRYPYSHDPNKIISGFSSFTKADGDFDPVCLMGKHWEVIKLDLLQFSGHESL